MDTNGNGYSEVSECCPNGNDPSLLTGEVASGQNATQKVQEASSTVDVNGVKENSEDLSNLASGVSVGVEEQALYVNQCGLNRYPCRSDWVRRRMPEPVSWLQAEVHIIQRDVLSAWAQIAWSVEAPSPQDWIGLYYLRKSTHKLVDFFLPSSFSRLIEYE